MMVFIFSNVQTNADSLQKYYEAAEESVETYIEIKEWLEENPSFPYAGAFIDADGVLNVLVKNYKDDDELLLTRLFGSEIIVLDAAVTFKELKNVYESLKENSEKLIERGIPFAGFYIRETENKVFIELGSIDTNSINLINEVIGEYPFIEYVEIIEPFQEQNRQSRIRPLVGGIKISYTKTGGNFASTLSFTAYDRVNNVEGDRGFVMSGHAATGTSDIYQHSVSTNKLVGTVESNPSGPRYSDAAFVAVNSTTEIKGAIYTATDVGGIIRSNNTPEGMLIRMHGMNSGIEAGEIITTHQTITDSPTYGTLWDQVRATYSSQSGDSGATVTNTLNNSRYDILGVHVGRRATQQDGDHAIYSPIDGVFTDLNIHRVLRLGEEQ